MRRGFIAFVAVALSTIFIVCLAGAEMCHQAEAAQGAEHCAKMKSCPGVGKCHSTMSAMSRRGMSPRSALGGGKRRKGHAEAGDLHQLGGPAFFVHHAEKLDLAEEQVENLKALKWDFQKSAIEKNAHIEVARVELKELMDQKSVDFGKIKAKISQIADMKKEMRLARLANIEKSHKILSVEQLESIKTLKRSRGPRAHCRTKEIVKEISIEEAPE